MSGSQRGKEGEKEIKERRDDYLLIPSINQTLVKTLKNIQNLIKNVK